MTTAIIAFSGGLDTSFLVPFSREKYGFDKIITCCVGTGGFSKEDQAKIAARSKEVGADEHVYIAAEKEYYDNTIRYLIYGNVNRDGYPLAVGAERMIQAKIAAEEGIKRGASAFIHGSTGAGNDQYRFDTVAHVLCQNKMRILAPVREFNVKREESTKYLRDRQVAVSDKAKYSYNVGLWGVSIGGAETLVADQLIPEDAWYSHPKADAKPITIVIHFDKGEPIYLEGKNIDETGSVKIIQKLTQLGNDLGVGRHYYTGTSIPGKKGRLGYEAPAADILYHAHRCLEQITLTNRQIYGKRALADQFGQLLHEAEFFDPYYSNLKTFLQDTQQRVSGVVQMQLHLHYIGHAVASSPYNLMAVKGSTYGESSDAYSGVEAEGSAKIHAYEQRIYHSYDKAE